MVLLVDYSKRRSFVADGSITILGQTYNEEEYSATSERLRATMMRSNSMGNPRSRRRFTDDDDDCDSHEHAPGNHYFRRHNDSDDDDDDDDGMMQKKKRISDGAVKKKKKKRTTPRRISSFDYRALGQHRSRRQSMSRKSDAAIAVAALEAAVAAAEEEERLQQLQQQQQLQKEQEQEDHQVAERRSSLRISLSSTNRGLSAEDRKLLADEVAAALDDDDDQEESLLQDEPEMSSARSSLSSCDGLTKTRLSQTDARQLRQEAEAATSVATSAPKEEEEAHQQSQEVEAPTMPSSLCNSTGPTTTEEQHQQQEEEELEEERQSTEMLQQEAVTTSNSVADKEEEEQEQEMPSLLNGMSNLGGPTTATNRFSRSQRKNKSMDFDERMPTTSTATTIIRRTTTEPVNPTTFQTHDLIKEHRNRRPTVLVEADYDELDMSESNTNHFGNDSDGSLDFGDLLAEKEEEEENKKKKNDWSKPSRVTVDKNAPSVSKAFSKPRRHLNRSASASQVMGANLSCITEGADNDEEPEEEETPSTKKPNRASLMNQARGNQSLNNLNLSSRNIFANANNNNNENKKGKRAGLLQKTMSFTMGRGLSPKKKNGRGLSPKKPRRGLGQRVLSFTLRKRQTPGRSKSLDESISSVARFEQSMSTGLAISNHNNTRDLEDGKIPSMAGDGSNSSSNKENGWKSRSISKPPRPAYRRSRSMDNSMSFSNLDASTTRIPAGYGRRDSRFGCYEGLPDPPNKRSSDPTCCHPIQPQQQCPPHSHKHGPFGGCAHCDRRLKLSKNTSISKLIMESRMEHTDVVGRVRTRPTLGRKSMSMSLVTSSRRKEEDDDERESDIPTDIACDLVAIQRDLVSFQRKSARNLKKILAEKGDLAEVPELESMKEDDSSKQQVIQGIPSAQDLGYGDDTPESQPVSRINTFHRRKQRMMIGSLSDGEYTTDEESDYEEEEDCSNRGLDSTQHGGNPYHRTQRRAASMGHVSKGMDSSAVEEGGRPSLGSAALGKCRNPMALRSSTGQASRRNLMGDKNKQMDTSGFVTGSRIRRIDDASQLFNGDASQLWGSKRW